jgi:hypothetical protein
VSLLAELGDKYKLAGFRDITCDNSITQYIQRLINNGGNDDIFCVSVGGIEITNQDAQRVVSRNNSAAPPDIWLNDNNVQCYIGIQQTLPFTIASAFHLHPVHTSFFLFNAWRMGELEMEACRVASQTKQKNIMTTMNLSCMVINLYNTHWFTAVIYPKMKRIDLINSMATSEGTRNVLCRLFHVYLWAHSTIDLEFGAKFNISEWSICAIRTNRTPQQLNGNDCGAYTLKAIDYLIAGKPLSWSQNSMKVFRTQILVALRLRVILSLSNPGQDLVLSAIQPRLEYIERELQQLQQGEQQNENKDNEEDNVKMVEDFLQIERKRELQKKMLKDEGFCELDKEISEVVYN